MLHSNHSYFRSSPSFVEWKINFYYSIFNRNRNRNRNCNRNRNRDLRQDEEATNERIQVQKSFIKRLSYPNYAARWVHIHTYIRTYIHTNTHTYTHTHSHTARSFSPSSSYHLLYAIIFIILHSYLTLQQLDEKEEWCSTVWGIPTIRLAR